MNGLGSILAMLANSSALPPGYYIPGTNVRPSQDGLAARMGGLRQSQNYVDDTATHPSLDMRWWLTHGGSPQQRSWLENFTACYDDLGRQSPLYTGPRPVR